MEETCLTLIEQVDQRIEFYQNAYDRVASLNPTSSITAGSDFFQRQDAALESLRASVTALKAVKGILDYVNTDFKKDLIRKIMAEQFPEPTPAIPSKAEMDENTLRFWDTPEGKEELRKIRKMGSG